MDNEKIEAAELERLKKDAGLTNMPTQLTYRLRSAVGAPDSDDMFSLAYQWQDKPHRLLYNACARIEEMEAATAGMVPRAVPDEYAGLVEDAKLRLKNAEDYSDAARIAVSADVRLISRLVAAITSLTSTASDLRMRLITADCEWQEQSSTLAQTQRELAEARVEKYAAFTDGMEAAAQICGGLAETTYDDSDGFEAATGCEASIMRVVKDQRKEQSEARAQLARKDGV